MPDPYVGEISLFAGNFAPAGWAFCSGQLLEYPDGPLHGNYPLFQKIGTIYGGDGVTTFALPDLRGRVPIHKGQGTGLSDRLIGGVGGVETVTLQTQHLPGHTHALTASSNAGSQRSPAGNVLGAGSNVKVYRPISANDSFEAGAIEAVGGGQPHDNMQPWVGISYIISLFGRTS